MSGGVGPSNDMGITRKEGEIHEQPLGSALNAPPPAARRHPFSFRQLHCLAIMVVLSASGMVAAEDFAFVVFSLLYIFFLSKVAFPPLSASPPPPVFGEKNRTLGLYVFSAAIVGLFLPICYIFEGILEGDQEGIKAAAPHLFLLASQVFMEGVTFSGSFSLPIRAFVPVLYNGHRLFAITEWMRNEFAKVEGEHGSARRLVVGRGLAIANMAVWSFNLFGFLLPVYLPRAMKSYYGYKEKA